MDFGKNFVWGAAAASFQIEGAAREDGKGASVWDMMCQTPGKIWQGHTGDVACDHYHHYKKDVALMKEIGLHAYRLSISWPRVLPSGRGKINEAGLSFYDRLVDELLGAGIAPWITLFHWDFPHDLYCKGGWLNRDSADWFAEYTSVIVDRLSDRVSHWMTLNEPQCFIGLGMEYGIHAPGDRLGRKEVLRAAHHVLLSHGRAVEVIRSAGKTQSIIGWAPVVVSAFPETPTEKNIEATRKAMFSHDTCFDLNNDRKISVWSNTWWGDPVVFGKYPEDSWEAFGSDVPEILSGDMEIISQPIDFYGANIYCGVQVRQGDNGKPEMPPYPTGTPLTAFRWPVTPDALGWGVKLIHERYQRPVVVTENGLSCHDWPSLDGEVHDPQRIDFLNRYLLSLGKTIESGADVRGYFQWSIMDNFEWAEGYKERFGLIYIDYPTQKRILKDSAKWYRTIIESNGEALERINRL
jgi:beta-glucosidase